MARQVLGVGAIDFAHADLTIRADVAGAGGAGLGHLAGHRHLLRKTPVSADRRAGHQRAARGLLGAVAAAVLAAVALENQPRGCDHHPALRAHHGPDEPAVLHGPAHDSLRHRGGH
ncbi:hypothetical protein G6F22_019704 [Rhizopus arrhizus]|nr:hypothetical protein G6F22_019704 [Rhizopus arrhizus]